MNDKQVAKKHCANYGKGDNEGICSGLFFIRENNSKVMKKEAKKLAGKECNPTKCTYYKDIVLPGVHY